MRRRIIAANWKMHKTTINAVEFIEEFIPLHKADQVSVVICPPFTAIETVSNRLSRTGIDVGAQDVHWEPMGAFTGEVSAPMLADLGCSYCIVGHSERRAMFGETDASVGQKASALLSLGITPIICVGETMTERGRGETASVVKRQLLAAVEQLNADQAGNIVIAYEPVWAIGSGTPATPDDALIVTALIRDTLDSRFGGGLGQKVQVQYGGSVKPENILDFLKTGQIDGALVGGASLQAKSFAALVNNAGRA